MTFVLVAIIVLLSLALLCRSTTTVGGYYCGEIGQRYAPRREPTWFCGECGVALDEISERVACGAIMVDYVAPCPVHPDALPRVYA